MPLYEYQCDVCGRFEVIVKFSDPPLEKCPTCGGPVRKLFSSPAIQFKGTGFYITDYAKKDHTPAGKSGDSEGKTAGKDEGGKSDKNETSEKKSDNTESREKSSSTSESSSTAAKPSTSPTTKDSSTKDSSTKDS